MVHLDAMDFFSVHPVWTNFGKLPPLKAIHGEIYSQSFFEQSKFFVLLNVPAHSAQPFQ